MDQYCTTDERLVNLCCYLHEMADLLDDGGPSLSAGDGVRMSLVAAFATFPALEADVERRTQRHQLDRAEMIAAMQRARRPAGDVDAPAPCACPAVEAEIEAATATTGAAPAAE